MVLIRAWALLHDCIIMINEESTVIIVHVATYLHILVCSVSPMGYSVLGVLSVIRLPCSLYMAVDLVYHESKYVAILRQ